MSSVFSLECAANYCIDSLFKGKNFTNDIDKLPYLSKFEIFLGLMFPNRIFDRGRTEIQEIQELKSIRDAYVHQKIKSTELKEPDDRGLSSLAGSGAVINVLSGTRKEFDFGRSKLLNIPRSIDIWQSHHAVNALKATVNFLNYFFTDLCGFDSNTTCGLLMSNQKAKIPAQDRYFISNIQEFIRANKEWGLNLDFLGFKENTQLH